MKPLIVIAYRDYADITEEQRVLAPLDPRIVQFTDFDAPESQEVLTEASAIMVSTKPITAKLLARMPHCRIVSRVGTGIDAIDLAAAAQRGIWVTNVPDYGVDEVSTHAISLLLAYARRIPQLIDSTRNGKWDYRVIKPITRLKGQVLGIVGFGRIAQAVATKGLGLGLTVLSYDPYVDPLVIEAAGVRPVTLEVLLRESDYISLHVPLTPESHHLINRQALEQMKSTALLINTARGPLIDEDALLAGLREGRLAGAALDVLTVEPPAPDHPLLHDERVWITPHTAWFSEQASVDMRVRAAEEIVRILRGEQPRSPVNKPIDR